jgi:hypothetical protein
VKWLDSVKRMVVPANGAAVWLELELVAPVSVACDCS